MKKFQMLGLAVVAMVSLSAMVAASAFANEWLAAGAVIASPLASETAGTIVMTDLLGILKISSAAVECKGIFVGTVGKGAADTITELLNTAKEKIGTKLTGTALECKGTEGCSSSVTALVWPQNLPWAGEVELMAAGASEFLDLVLASGAGSPGWEVECTVAGIKESDECLGEGTGTSVLKNVTDGVENIASLPEQEANNELASCTLGGAKEGHISGSGLTTLVNKEALTVS